VGTKMDLEAMCRGLSRKEPNLNSDENISTKKTKKVIRRKGTKAWWLGKIWELLKLWSLGKEFDLESSMGGT